MRQVSSAAMASGSGIVPDDNFQEPVHGQRDNSNATASPSDGDGASPSPPPAAPVDPPEERLRQQAGSGTNESTSAAAGVDENGKKPASPSPPRSAGRSPSTTSSSSDSTSLGGVGTVDRKKVFKKLVPEAEKKKPEGGQVKSSHPKKSLWSKCKSSLSRKKKIDGEGSQMGWEHVDHQTFPISEVGKHYRATKDRPILLNLDAFSRIRRVLGDGECFYRSFIYSYLEQVLDRQDTHEEQRLLDTVKRVSKKHRNLGWATEFRFRRSYKAFKKLIQKTMEWKSEGTSNNIASTNSYRKEKLFEFFRTYDTTNDSIHICSHRGQYGDLIRGIYGFNSLKDWCLQYVTKPREHADHLMMTALATALGVTLRLERLYGGGSDQDNMYTGPGAVTDLTVHG